MRTISPENWELVIGPMLDPIYGWGPSWASPLREAWEAWGDDADHLEDVINLMVWASIPLRETTMFRDWKDDVNPLGSLLEMLSGARVAGLHGIFPSVITGQLMHEAGMNPNRKAPLGIKATKADILAGTWAELSTLEVLCISAVNDLARAGKLQKVIRVLPDGRQEVRCLQKFHFEPGLRDDLLKVVDVYEKFWTRDKKPRPRAGWTPADFLRLVTQASPAYATGGGYVESVMHYVEKYRLDVLDSALILPA